MNNNKNQIEPNKNNVIDSINQTTITETIDKIGDKLYGTITKSFTKREISDVEAITAKNVPKSLWRLSGFLDKFFKIQTLTDVLKNNNESWLQKIITDGPRFLPKGYSILGEIWNSSMDFILKIKPPKEHPLEMMWQTKGTITGQASSIDNISQSNPHQQMGVFNGQKLDQNKSTFLEQNGLLDMHKQYGHLYTNTSFKTNKVNKTNSNINKFNPRTNSSVIAGRAWVEPPPPIIMLDSTLAANYNSQSVQLINSYISGTSNPNLTDAGNAVASARVQSSSSRGGGGGGFSWLGLVVNIICSFLPNNNPGGGYSWNSGSGNTGGSYNYSGSGSTNGETSGSDWFNWRDLFRRDYKPTFSSLTAHILGSDTSYTETFINK